MPRRPEQAFHTSRLSAATAWRRRCIVALAAWLSAGTAVAAGANCNEAAATRLPGIEYQCLHLTGAQRLWVGRGGPPDKPTVLLVHGLGTNAHSDWASTIGVLTRHWRVLTVDLPGFGASPSPQPLGIAAAASLLAELIAMQTPEQRAHVVGHSLGAALSLHLAHRYAQRVDRLVLVSAAGILLKPVFLHSLAAVPAPPLGFAPLDRLTDFAARGVNALSGLALLGHDQRVDVGPWLDRHPRVRRTLVGGSPQVDLALALVEHDFSVAIRETRAPTTVLWGSADRIAPLRTGELLNARMPDARLAVMNGVGHTPMAESPDAFHRLLLQALSSGVAAQAEVEPDAPSRGDVVCRNEDRVIYTGRFDSLTLERCGDVRIEHARIGRLVARQSTLTLRHTRIDSGADVALTAVDSEVIATATLLQGRVAIEADNSWFDLAGASLRASGPVFRVGYKPSRAFLSVSDWEGSDLAGDAHGVWPRGRY